VSLNQPQVNKAHAIQAHNEENYNFYLLICGLLNDAFSSSIIQCQTDINMQMDDSLERIWTEVVVA
jgi:hypothetical protein